MREMGSFMAKLLTKGKIQANVEIAFLNNDQINENNERETGQEVIKSEFDAWRNKTDQNLDVLLKISAQTAQDLKIRFVLCKIGHR
jgi:hypothetical protein